MAQIHNPEIHWQVFHSLRRLRVTGEIGIRFRAFVPIADWQRIAQIVAEEGSGDDWVRWGGVKGLADGSLGSRTAKFYEPYSDAPSERGIWIIGRDKMRELVGEADRHGLQVAMHAIGDKANDTTLDVFETVAAANGARDRRFRIEHAQHIRPASIARFARQGVIASMQPYHAIDDGRWAVKRIGPGRLAGHLRLQVHDRVRCACRVRIGLAGRAPGPADRPERRGISADDRRSESFGLVTGTEGLRACRR